MIDLYQMASLAGISGSWLTDGEMLWLRPLSSPSRERERALNGDRAGGEWLWLGNGKRMGMKAGRIGGVVQGERNRSSLRLKVMGPLGGPGKVCRVEG